MHGQGLYTSHYDIGEGILVKSRVMTMWGSSYLNLEPCSITVLDRRGNGALPCHDDISSPWQLLLIKMADLMDFVCLPNSQGIRYQVCLLTPSTCMHIHPLHY